MNFENIQMAVVRNNILLTDRIGEVNKNTFGSNIKIIEYNNCNDIMVEFDNGYKKHCTYKDFKKGLVKSPYEKRLCGVGYLGEGIYKATFNNKHTNMHQYWDNMIRRCYDEGYHKSRPTYIGCSVCEEWHNYQIFGEWFNKNYYEIDNEVMCLDKDILIKGNKIYSPDNCIFVPITINSLLVKCNKSRGNLPIGVSLAKNNNNKFRVEYCNIMNNIKLSKTFDTMEEAFNAYKIHKEKHIKLIADKYKNIIPNKLYNALYNYQVEISD